MMSEWLLTSGSLAAVWLTVWFVLACLLMALHRLLRPVLHGLHPASASAVLLMLCLAPLLMSLGGAALLYLSGSDGLLVDAHCHDDCAAHVPLVSSVSVAAAGLGTAFTILVLLFGKALRHARSVSQLGRQLECLAEGRRGYRLLQFRQPMVFTLGWMRPRVYVSRGLLSQCDARELGVILSHERAHRRRLDNLRLLTGRLLCVILPGWLKQGLLDDLELFSEQACDFAAARRYGAVPVARTLVHMKRLLQRMPATAGVQAFTGSEVEMRVHALLGRDRRLLLGRMQLLGLLGLVILVVLAGVEPLHHATEWVLGSTH